ncbi:MAG: hypothetical protein INR73_03165 [Williamsia sp.]|nr:hypothetical protein [Williamsia sp.]
MKKKSLAAFIGCVICFIGAANAQNYINIARIGKNLILVSNASTHAVTVQIGSNEFHLLRRGFTKRVEFELSEYNVRNKPFLVFYSYQCFVEDSLDCMRVSRREEEEQNFQKAIEQIVALLAQGKPLGLVLDLIRFFYSNTVEREELFNEIRMAYGSNSTLEQKIRRINAIAIKYHQRLERIQIAKENCVAAAGVELARNKNAMRYYASQFMDVKENFRMDLTAYTTVGFRVRSLKGVAYPKESLKSLDFSQTPGFGARAALVYNAYDSYNRIKKDTKIYFPFEYMKTAALYKSPADNIFKRDSALSWEFYSGGIGWEYLQRNKKNRVVGSLNIDFGLITSVLYQHSVNNSKKTSTDKIRSFKGFGPYLNVGGKVKLLKWLDLYGSYYTTILYDPSPGRAKKVDLPSFRQFNVGINISPVRVFSYQY